MSDPKKRPASVRQNVLRWIRALRSGKYEQGRMTLRKDDRYCCLGVACDVLGLEWIYDRSAGDFVPVGNSGKPTALDETNRALFGMAYEDMSRFMAMNDRQNTGFGAIADAIEQTLLPRYPVKRRSRPSPQETRGRNK